MFDVMSILVRFLLFSLNLIYVCHEEGVINTWSMTGHTGDSKVSSIPISKLTFYDLFGNFLMYFLSAIIGCIVLTVTDMTITIETKCNLLCFFRQPNFSSRLDGQILIQRE